MSPDALIPVRTGGRRALTAIEIWRWPLALAVLVLLGLGTALAGASDLALVLSWGALAIPLVVIVACVLRARRPQRSSS